MNKVGIARTEDKCLNSILKYLEQNIQDNKAEKTSRTDREDFGLNDFPYEDNEENNFQSLISISNN